MRQDPVDQMAPLFRMERKIALSFPYPSIDSLQSRGVLWSINKIALQIT